MVETLSEIRTEIPGAAAATGGRLLGPDSVRFSSTTSMGPRTDPAWRHAGQAKPPHLHQAVALVSKKTKRQLHLPYRVRLWEKTEQRRA